MSTIVSRLNITQIFCEVDDFCSSWEKEWQQVPQLPSMTGERRSTSRMHLSEVMTIAIASHSKCKATTLDQNLFSREFSFYFALKELQILTRFIASDSSLDSTAH